jgi:hypothetical protein
MSVEWYKYRVRSGVDRDGLAELIREQSQGFRTAVNLPPSGGAVAEEEREAAVQSFWRSTRELLPLLSFVGRESAEGGEQEVDRNHIAFIAFNDIFPIEWREEAKSTILPEELPDLLEKWQTYAQDLRMGYYEDYLCRLFLYEDYNPHHNGFPCWAQLLESFHVGIQAAPGRTEDWAQTRAFTRTLEEFYENPVLAFTFEPPKFDFDARETDLQPETRSAFEEYKKETERLMSQVLAWNRCVPESEKLRIHTFIPVQVRMRQRVMNSRNWLQPFFEWCEEVVEDGCGLFLAP